MSSSGEDSRPLEAKVVLCMCCVCATVFLIFYIARTRQAWSQWLRRVCRPPQLTPVHPFTPVVPAGERAAAQIAEWRQEEFRRSLKHKSFLELRHIAAELRMSDAELPTILCADMARRDLIQSIATMMRERRKELCRKTAAELCVLMATLGCPPDESGGAFESNDPRRYCLRWIMNFQSEHNGLCRRTVGARDGVGSWRTFPRWILCLCRRRAFQGSPSAPAEPRAEQMEVIRKFRPQLPPTPEELQDFGELRLPMPAESQEDPNTGCDSPTGWESVGSGISQVRADVIGRSLEVWFRRSVARAQRPKREVRLVSPSCTVSNNPV